MNIDRSRFQQVRALRRVHDSAVRVARLDNAVTGAAVEISTVVESETTVDADGNTLRPFMFWGDNWGSNWS